MDEAQQVADFRARHGLNGLIDVHTHFMPSNVMDKVWSYFDSAGPLVGRAWPITYRHAEEERVERLRGFRVRRFTAMLYPHKPAMAAWLNAWAVDFAARTPDCLHTATFYPEPDAAGYVAAALEHGARVFKSHIQVGDYDPNDPLLDPVWGLLEDAGVPIVIHCGSGPAPGTHTGPGPIAALLERFPRLALIVAHMGMPEYRQFLDLAEKYPRVHLDTTMAFTDFTQESMPFPEDELPRLQALGSKVLFGSDFPNIPYPYVHQLEAVERLGLGSEWVRAVCWDNAQVLFGAV
ncbi:MULTISPECIES: amidohydrolase family protein [Rhodococcus]|jgi:predicted TIM-barrel fold metal-dependent hydrolase|uniref:Amidohydrolase n=1 Tax=Rhodococcus aetherivorans TaxID=191292 RepID=A0AA46NZA6_9NOCA|nr:MULTISPECIES: amidohydrolase family protein [Rhodococcus]ANZ23434.1 amidohydrolase [Rhodococcus sp. WB1]MBC2589590.1 amidohydrolase [Rhodococcus aetherivorans]MDV6295940.1 amidohydrolase family protein [Rhodococcus aetherivorans]PND52617.1 amidohydrolase [Rhodococcus sp. ENV425]QRI77420.1 amidohydrolase [Rhodococcus aetherivorans]